MAQIEAICLSNRGKICPHNEDNFIFCGKVRETDPIDESLLLYSKRIHRNNDVVGVFDGMGGQAHGERASMTAANCFLTHLAQKKDFDEFFLNNCKLANRMIQQSNTRFGEDSGSTAAVIGFSYKDAVLCNVGDSRIYRYSKNKLELLSKDHTDQELLNSMGINTRTPRLMQYLGMENDLDVYPEIKRIRFCLGDMFLCCTDGLYLMLTNDEIVEILNETSPLHIMALKLMNTALKNGGTDNISFVLCRVKFGL